MFSFSDEVINTFKPMKHVRHYGCSDEFMVTASFIIKTITLIYFLKHVKATSFFECKSVIQYKTRVWPANVFCPFVQVLHYKASLNLLHTSINNLLQ